MADFSINKSHHQCCVTILKTYIFVLAYGNLSTKQQKSYNSDSHLPLTYDIRITACTYVDPSFKLNVQNNEYNGKTQVSIEEDTWQEIKLRKNASTRF